MFTSPPPFRGLFPLDLSFPTLQQTTVDASRDKAATTTLSLTLFSSSLLLLFCFYIAVRFHTIATLESETVPSLLWYQVLGLQVCDTRLSFSAHKAHQLPACSARFPAHLAFSMFPSTECPLEPGPPGGNLCLRLKTPQLIRGWKALSSMEDPGKGTELLPLLPGPCSPPLWRWHQMMMFI